MKSPAVKLASKLLGSSVLAQLAVLAATAVVASRLAPTDFAIFGAITGLSAIVAAVNTLAAESRATVLEDATARALLRAGGTSTMIATVLIGAGGVVGIWLGRQFGMVLLLGAGCAALLGCQQLITAVVLRNHLQHLLARGRLTQGLSNAALLLAFLSVPMPGYLILTLPWLISLALGVLAIWLGCRERIRMSLARRGDWSLLRREVGEQPIANLLGSSVAAMPLLLLPALGFHSFAGLWALVSRILRPIVNTVYNTLQPLYYARAAQHVRDGEWGPLRSLHRRWFRFLLVGAVPVAVGTYGLCYWILPLLGPQWRVGVGPALAGTVYFTSLVVCLPLSQTLVMVHRVRLAVTWTAFRCAACLAPFGVISIIGPMPALLAWAVASAITFGWQIVLNDRSIAGYLEPEVAASPTPLSPAGPDKPAGTADAHHQES